MREREATREAARAAARARLRLRVRLRVHEATPIGFHSAFRHIGNGFGVNRWPMACIPRLVAPAPLRLITEYSYLLKHFPLPNNRVGGTVMQAVV